MNDFKLIPLIILFAAGGGLFYSCARSMNPDIERGTTFQFREGYPEVRLSGIGFLDETGQPYINVSADIVYGSLVYRERNDSMVADLTVEISIAERGENGTTLLTNHYNFSIGDTDSDIVNSQEVFTFNREFETPPGSFEVQLSVTDLNSDKKTNRTATAVIPDPARTPLNVTNIKMLGKINDESPEGWKTVTTYDVKGKMDSLKFVFQVTTNRGEEPTTIRSRLIRFASDTSTARPMHYNNYSPSSLQYKGIDYDKTQVIQSSTRTLNQQGSVSVEFIFPRQRRGNYRFEVSIDDSEAENLFKGRDFSVKSENYPSIKTPRELAEPLAYLASNSEYEKIIATRDPDSLKIAVDRFWLSKIKNSRRAKNVIALYYERVEKANKQFSNFKEGWKTDTGMMYILFGPPWYVDRRLTRMQWSYSYDRSDPRSNFFFEQPKIRSEFYPFDNFLLLRSQGYFNVEYQQVQLWLSGHILTRSL